ncbi:LLM class flavin-dependent oxidoreductase [Pseudoclavibacter chungangensis]|uniref:LLM class flavin-dependent oxidoreductase n=1 Tax=Pseudoclavibacter chungangensis TaxID=587635 RepID=A0A7J5C3A4_9MICO|nr:LLM class flavin-dependent oxidoreductase [Pseudoclavibacter chungangensis]KAB1662248.1 LLM class flavin-dependent oxidoreductase [Pseudoclavibacter chungangensis]NYJ65453.1 alkanesulfonate monooxygenase SsuD/methylene tetrahydromethanopterin reductase-like flavin-dependent oxidoreductase (luciferase family) [Pseudoclavibacter chungangensis]
MSGTGIPDTRSPRTGEIPELRIGFITHLDQHDDLGSIYRDNLRLVQALETLGYDSAWIATRHFKAGWATLPSPFAFYGAAAVSTERIALGTAVLPLLLDDPVRAAEEVSVVDHLSNGRLVLGLGKGVPSDSFHVFDSWNKNRDAGFVAKAERLQWALEGSQVEGGSESLHPPNRSLSGRVLYGSSNLETIRRAAENGEGFILERFGNGPERTAAARRGFQERQAESIRIYRQVFEETWGDMRTPYVVLSRSAYPGPTVESALAEAGTRVRRWNDFAARIGRVDPTWSVPDQLLSDNVPWGTPEVLAADLLADPSVALSDEIVLGVHPAHHTIDETIEKARILLEELVPLVRSGWRAQREELGIDELRTDRVTA